MKSPMATYLVMDEIFILQSGCSSYGRAHFGINHKGRAHFGINHKSQSTSGSSKIRLLCIKLMAVPKKRTSISKNGFGKIFGKAKGVGC